jgi:hypothetical protein
MKPEILGAQAAEPVAQHERSNQRQSGQPAAPGDEQWRQILGEGFHRNVQALKDRAGNHCVQEAAHCALGEWAWSGGCVHRRGWDMAGRRSIATAMRRVRIRFVTMNGSDPSAERDSAARARFSAAAEACGLALEARASLSDMR